jgi:hypothetical protein
MCTPLSSNNLGLLLAFPCYKKTSLNSCKEMMHQDLGNIIGMIFSIMFRMLHLIDLMM